MEPRKLISAIGATTASARAQIEAVGPILAKTPAPTTGQVLTWEGASWVPDGGSQRLNTVSATAVAGQQGFFLSWGSYIRASDLLEVTVDGVSASYGPMARQGGVGQLGWPQPTTADVVRGVWLTNPCVGGETVAIQFRTQVLLIDPPVPMVTFAPGGVLPTGLVPGVGNWIPNSYQNPAFVPNSFVLPQRAGLQIELWRRSRRMGRFRQALTVPGLFQIRQAHHFSPWWRSSLASVDGYEVVDPWVANIVNYSSWRANQFKLAWYDPMTGARSPLSVQSIMVQQRSERVLGTPSPTHPNMSVWISGR